MEVLRHTMMRIAILDDDTAFTDFLAEILTSEGHSCQSFHSGRSFLSRLHQDTFDLMIIDWSLPDADGLELLGLIKENLRSMPPVLLVTNRSEEKDIVAGLNAGADDYISKPIQPAVLVARVSALLRRAYPTKRNDAESFGRYQFVPVMDTVLIDGEPVPLTSKEFALALLLFRNMHRSLSRAYMLEAVWGRNPELPTRTLDAHISRIRTKLGLRPENGYKLTPVYSYGYRLEMIGAENGDA